MSEVQTNAAAVGHAAGQGRPAGEGKINWMNVLKFAGAFVAFMIGSGYATGQEIMQFFTAYGIWSIGGIAIATAIFAWLGKVLMNWGYRHREYDADQMANESFKYYCGKYFGTFLAWFIPLFLFLVCVVMTSGAGATISQYFGAPKWVGAGIMCVLVFVTNFFGFKTVLNIVGALGPLTILFSIVIAVYAIFENPAGLANLAEHAEELASMANATNGSQMWVLAGLLYVAFNMTGSVPFLTQTGGTAATARDAKWGAILGGLLFGAAGLLMNLALLCHIGEVYNLEVPTLYLSDLISPIVSVIFSLILIDEIYSTATPMMWTAVNRFAPDGTKANKIVLTVFCVAVFAIVMSPLSYGQLMGIIYPYTGYIGIVFIVCVVARQCIERYNVKNGKDIEEPLYFKKQ